MKRSERKLQSYLNGDKLHVRYTLLTDDLREGRTPHSMPYRDRKGYFDEKGYCADAQATLKVKEYEGGLKLTLKTTLEEISEFGLDLPINFMGKKNGGGWENQYLLNSAYTSEGNLYKYCYLTNPNGKNLMIFPKGKCDGWKCDYSSEYCPGHFFLELEFLASFDKVYETGSKNRYLELYIFEVGNIEEGLDRLCKTLRTCALSYEQSTYKIGEEITLRVHGECDRVRRGREYFIPEKGFVKIPVHKYGLTPAIPYVGKKRGLDCKYFGYDDLDKMWKRTIDKVDDVRLTQITSENLCEGSTWAPSVLRYMLRHNGRGFGTSKKRLKKLFAEMFETDPAKAVPQRTILNYPYDGEPAYYIFKSGRIQELLFGANILMDAYQLTGRKKLFTYFTGALDAVLESHFDNGMIYTEFLNGTREDYTTVCCLIIPFVDAALLLKDSHPALAAKYRKVADQIAAYLYTRKGFHTEAFVSEKTDPEMEDGSISCTALSLLYYCAKIERREDYLARAKEILDLHEPWVTHTPIAPCFHSSLRWWETFWNGDATGASICYGHAWTIWRAEADYWYYYLTGDERYKKKAYNGFASNFAKVEKSGETYSCYLADYIPGGGFHNESKDSIFPIKLGVPTLRDPALSRYVWMRAHESIFNEGFFQ